LNAEELQAEELKEEELEGEELEGEELTMIERPTPSSRQQADVYGCTLDLSWR